MNSLLQALHVNPGIFLFHNKNKNKNKNPFKILLNFEKEPQRSKREYMLEESE